MKILYLECVFVLLLLSQGYAFAQFPGQTNRFSESEVESINKQMRKGERNAPPAPASPVVRETGPSQPGIDLFAHGQSQADEAAKYLVDAMNGSVSAQCVLGQMYYFGNGVPLDRGEAEKWWRLAAAQGDESARANLASGKGDVDCIIGWISTDSLNQPTADSQVTPRRSSVLNQTVIGAISGAALGAIAGLFILVRAFIRKFKAPAKDATALTAAVGATAMQRLRQGIADYVGGTKECPFCKESVKARAVVCKHCHRDI